MRERRVSALAELSIVVFRDRSPRDGRTAGHDRSIVIAPAGPNVVQPDGTSRDAARREDGCTRGRDGWRPVLDSFSATALRCVHRRDAGLHGRRSAMSRLVFGWLTGLVAGMPAGLGYALASLLTGFHYHFFPRRRHAALANLAIVM